MYWHESAENDPPNRWLREQIKKVVDEALLKLSRSAQRRAQL